MGSVKDNDTRRQSDMSERPPFMLAYDSDPGGLPTGPVWAAMKARRDWLIWQAELDADKGKWDKLPRLPGKGGVVNRADAAKFTFDEATVHARHGGVVLDDFACQRPAVSGDRVRGERNPHQSVRNRKVVSDR